MNRTELIKYKDCTCFKFAGKSCYACDGFEEWIPPTDEERVMFANAAKQLRDRNRQYNLSEEARFIWCVPSLHDDMEFELGESADASLEIASRIAESLALDGMDIDQLSEIEKLMKEYRDGIR